MTHEPQSTAAQGQVSPDGQHVWNGTAWVANPNAPKQKKKHTVRNVLLVLLGLSVLFVGGCIAAGLVVRRLPGRRSLGTLFLRGFILAWAAELVLLILVVGIIAKNIGS